MAMLLVEITGGASVERFSGADEGNIDSPNDDRLYVDCQYVIELVGINVGDMESPIDDKLYADSSWPDVLGDEELAVEELPAMYELVAIEEPCALHAPYIG
jgi:hypothetical protein